MENDQDKNTGSDGGVGNVEYRPEKDKIIATPERKPLRIMPLDNWEIQQINNFSMKKCAVPAAFGKQGCYSVIRRIAEYEAVKSTVENIADGAGKDQRDAEDKPCVGFLPVKAYKIKTNNNNGNYSEKAKCQLAKLAAECKPESHSFVLGEMNDEPVAKYMILLPKGHVGLYPEFRNLVNQEYQENDQQRFFQCYRIKFLVFQQIKKTGNPLPGSGLPEKYFFRIFWK